MSSAPEGFSNARWHLEASADAGTDHTRHPRQYVVACEWCDHVVFAPTRALAIDKFDLHRAQMDQEFAAEQEESAGERKLKGFLGQGARRLQLFCENPRHRGCTGCDATPAPEPSD